MRISNRLKSEGDQRPKNAGQKIEMNGIGTKFDMARCCNFDNCIFAEEALYKIMQLHCLLYARGKFME